MPHNRRSLYPSGAAQLGGFPTFTIPWRKAKSRRNPVAREAGPQRSRPPKPVLYCLVTPDRRRIKIGTKVVSHVRLQSRFQTVEVAVSQQMFADICR